MAANQRRTARENKAEAKVRKTLGVWRGPLGSFTDADVAAMMALVEPAPTRPVVPAHQRISDEDLEALLNFEPAGERLGAELKARADNLADDPVDAKRIAALLGDTVEAVADIFKGRKDVADFLDEQYREAEETKGLPPIPDPDDPVWAKGVDIRLIVASETHLGGPMWFVTNRGWTSISREPNEYRMGARFHSVVKASRSLAELLGAFQKAPETIFGNTYHNTPLSENINRRDFITDDVWNALRHVVDWPGAFDPSDDFYRYNSELLIVAPVDDIASTDFSAHAYAYFEPTTVNAVVHPDTGMPVTDPATVWSILRGYKLLTGELVSGKERRAREREEREVAKILAAANGDRNDAPDKIPVLPFKNILTNEGDGNCVYRALCARYTLGAMPKGKHISEKSIAKALGVDPATGELADGTPPTCENVRKFASDYGIRYILFDATGRYIADTETGHGGIPKHESKGQRPPIIQLSYGNHYYAFSGTMERMTHPSHLDLGLTPGITTLPLYSDGRFPKRDQLSEREEEAFTKFMKLKTPNFSFLSEAGAMPRAMLWYDPSIADDEEYCRECAGVDMKKAYHTVTTNNQISRPDEKIGVFTVCDLVEEYDGHKIDPAAIYYLKKDAVMRWHESLDPVLKARAVGGNILMGFEVDYLINRGSMVECDISHFRQPSYTMPLENFRKGLEKIAAESGITDEEERKCFALYNGLLGRSWTHEKRVYFEDVTEEDAKVLAHKRDAKYTAQRKSIDITVGGKQYLYLNNRNLYAWVVSRCNLAMMQFVDDMRASNPGIAIHKIKVDGVVFSRAPNLGKYSNLFKSEAVSIRKQMSTPGFTDGAKVAEGIAAELATFKQQTEVVTGPPGVGKTHKVKEDEQYDIAFAMTNTTARNLDTEKVKGETIFAAMNLFAPENLFKVLSKFRGKTLWLDEFSMVQAWIWSFIFIATRTCKIIITGDPNQCPPIGEKGFEWSEDEKAWRNPFLRLLLEGSTRLTKDYRNDDLLVRFRDVVEKRRGAVVQDLVDTILREIPSYAVTADNAADALTHITYTNKARRNVNTFVADKLGMRFDWKIVAERAPAVDGLAPNKELTEHQAAGRIVCEFNATKGVRLSAVLTRKKMGIYKGALYTLVDDVTPASTEFTIIRDGCDEPQTIKPIGMLRAFTLGYATTSDSSQGITAKGPVYVYEYKKMLTAPVISDKRRFYTAVTRARKMCDLKFASAVPFTAREREDPPIRGLTCEEHHNIGDGLVYNR